MTSNRSRLQWVVLLIVLILALPALAQEQKAEEKQPEGINQGNYNIKQTFEFGYRWSDVTGNRDVFNTMVNLNPGPRVLEYTLEMRSLNHAGWLFDNLFFTNFGYGGDPNDVSRLRMYKNKWYNFSATFRRDRNFWDYNLLANPLNPATIPTNAPAGFTPIILNSPHSMQLTRRMSDINLTLLPQSRLRFRLGYNRNISEGPSFTTFHEGTDVLLFQPWKTTVNSYQFGVDFKFLPKTNISYDQFFYGYKGDTSWQNRLSDVNTTFLSNGTPVDLGLIVNTAANQPCGAPFNASPLGTVNPTCNGYLTYRREGRARTDYPIEQISFQSNYFQNVDLSGRFSYSSSDNDVRGYDEFFQGLVSRTRQRQFGITGPSTSKRVVATADAGVTIHVTNKFRIQDSFRFNHFRIPGLFTFEELSLFGTSMLVAPNIFTPGTTPPVSCPTITSAGCPQHNTSSPADVISGVTSRFLGQNTKVNTFDLEYDFTRHFGGRIGYRNRTRRINERFTDSEDLLFFPTLPNRGACAGVALQPDGSCFVTTRAEDAATIRIDEHSGLFGLWARPNNQVRISFDMELISADNTLTRISPRQRQQYKSRLNWKPVEWMSFGFALNLLESRNNVSEIFHKQHNRAVGFNWMLEPNSRFTLDLGYDYNHVSSQTNICYALAGAPPPGSTPCPLIVGGTSPLQGISIYRTRSHFGFFDMRWQPWQRVTTRLGLALTRATGFTTFLSPNVPSGPLDYGYYKPYGGFEIFIAKGFSWKADWTFYNYGENALFDPRVGVRSFRGNQIVLAIRNSF